MSIIIKGMEMPKSCDDCVAEFGGCCFAAPPEADGVCPDHGKADWCPLVEIPPHGRLIDADTLTVRHGWLDNFDNTHTHIQFVYANEINRTPTIIESEKEVKDG